MSDTIFKSDLAVMPEKGESVFGPKHWRLWVLLSEAALIGTGVAFLYWPVLNVSDVTYEGPADWEAEVRSLVTLPSDGNILHFIPADAESRIESRFSDRGDAQVRVVLPNQISIRINAYAPRLWGDGEIGIAQDGALLIAPPQRPYLPRWNPGIDWQGSMPLAERAKRAAGAWDELSRADRRYELTTDEWTCDPSLGWTTTAVDGRTRAAFGHTMVEERARLVARLLDQGDTLLAKPCFIDARFEGRLLHRLLPEVAPDSTKTDSTAAVAAANAQSNTKDAKPVHAKTAEGKT